jgi:hypothetical protein
MGLSVPILSGKPSPGPWRNYSRLKLFQGYFPTALLKVCLDFLSVFGWHIEKAVIRAWIVKLVGPVNTFTPDPGKSDHCFD